ncbi:MAG: tautomerase family protein [Bdellovibrionota bacterium]
MPIVTINAVPPSEPRFISKMISDVRDRGAEALQCPVSNIWVVFQPLAPQTPANAHPPFVIILAQSGRTKEVREALVSSVAEAVGTGLGVSSTKVWIHYQEMNPQDVWFEGRWSG